MLSSDKVFDKKVKQGKGIELFSNRLRKTSLKRSWEFHGRHGSSEGMSYRDIEGKEYLINHNTGLSQEN